MSIISLFLPVRPAAALRHLAALAALGVTLGACSSKNSDDTPEPGLIQPTGPKPAYAPTIDPQMQAVLEQFLSFETPPLPTLSPRQARMAPSITDAVLTLLHKNNRGAREPNVSVTQRLLPGGHTSIGPRWHPGAPL